jgi:hypothetical protein
MPTNIEKVKTCNIGISCDIIDESCRVPQQGVPTINDQEKQTRSQTRKQGLHDIGPSVFSPSHPLCHRGVQGWPVILGTRHYSGLYSTRQNFTSKAPSASLPPLDPIKGQAGDSTKGGG